MQLARTDIRRLYIPTAIRIFRALQQFAETGSGDIKKLKGDTDELRLRLAIGESVLSSNPIQFS